MEQAKEKQTIMIVDDDENLREIYSRMFSKDYNTIIKQDGAEALETLKERKDISLLLTDEQMPVMNGIQLVKETRKIGHYSDLYIILCSGTSTEELAKSAGANYFLSKPVNFANLCSLVNNAVNNTLEKKVL